MKHEEKVVLFWDGQELCNLIDLHYAKVAFFDDLCKQM